MKGCSKGIVLCQVPTDSFFCIPSWRGIFRRKWWFFSLHATQLNFIQNYLDTSKSIALISMENKSSKNVPLRFLTFVKQRRVSCYALTLLLEDLIFHQWYIFYFRNIYLSVACNLLKNVPTKDCCSKYLMLTHYQLISA